MNKKYEFTGETMEYKGHTLRRIRSLVDIPGNLDRICGTAAKGSSGGWIESEKNLSHEGNCWVRGEAKVYGDATVAADALLFDHAEAYDKAYISGSAVVHGNAAVYGEAVVCGHARVFENAAVCEFARVYENAVIYGNALIKGNCMVCGKASIWESAQVFDYAYVLGSALVHGEAKVSGNALVHCASVWGTAVVSGTAQLCYGASLRDGHLTDTSDYVCCGPVGSRKKFTTFNKTSGTVCTGCFEGSLEKFEKAVEETHGDNKHGKDYKKLIAYFRTLVND